LDVELKDVNNELLDVLYSNQEEKAKLTKRSDLIQRNFYSSPNQK
jgi:hypothetical protein